MDDLNREPPIYPKQVLEFSVDLPASVNHMYYMKGNHKCLNARAKKYIQETQKVCIDAIKNADWQREGEHVWFYMDMYFYFPDKRLRDSHNLLKLLLDTLEGLPFGNDYFVMPRIQHVALDRKKSPY